MSNFIIHPIFKYNCKISKLTKNYKDSNPFDFVVEDRLIKIVSHIDKAVIGYVADGDIDYIQDRIDNGEKITPVFCSSSVYTVFIM